VSVFTQVRQETPRATIGEFFGDFRMRDRGLNRVPNEWLLDTKNPKIPAR
jgi:hypothetical protein